MPRTTRKTAAAARNALSTRLREGIRNRGLTAYALARDADIDPGVVQRFVTGRRDIRLETADRIAAALGLRLVEAGRVGARPPRQAGSESPVATEGNAGA